MTHPIDRNRKGSLVPLVDPRAFLALRVPVVVVLVVIWNALLFLSIWLNDGSAIYHDDRARAVAACTALAFALFFWAVVESPRLRDLVTEPRRRERYHPGPYACLAFMLAALGVPMLAGVVGLR